MRRCKATKADGTPCRAPPLLNGDGCRFHDPKNTQAVQESRRVGGFHRRKHGLADEVTFNGFSSLKDVQRLLEIAAGDVLRQEASMSRARSLAFIAQTAVGIVKACELERRVEMMETAIANGGSFTSSNQHPRN
jgi:hypothetical protein